MDILLLDRRPETLADMLRPGLGDARLHPVSSAAEALPLAPDMDAAIVMPPLMNRELVQKLTKLRWIQALSAGIDPLLPLDIAPEVTITTAAGVHAPQMAELVFFQMLCLLRDVRRVLADQATHRWKPTPQRLLCGRRLLIVGVGKIAVELAGRAARFGMRVTGVSGGRREAPDFSAILPMERLAEAVADADIVVQLAPYSARTHHLFDARIFAAMPPGGFFINVGRGKVVDQAALEAVLRDRRIAGAALDVFETEPLPVDSPLWEMDNLLITPHIGGFSDIFAQQVVPLLLDNVARWRARSQLVNEVAR